MRWGGTLLEYASLVRMVQTACILEMVGSAIVLYLRFTDLEEFRRRVGASDIESAMLAMSRHAWRLVSWGVFKCRIEIGMFLVLGMLVEVSLHLAKSGN